MLIQFSVENFLSIKDNVVLSLLASKDNEHPEHLIVDGSKKHLKSAVIYGANASGKSNVLNAFWFMVNYVLTSHNQQLHKTIERSPFKFDRETPSRPSSFEVIFTTNGIRYAYGFSVTDKVVIEEYLYYYPNGRQALIFERKDTKDFRFTVDVDAAAASRDAVLFHVNATVAESFNGPRVDTYAHANATINMVQNAINNVSGQRSALGALQNRLEHTISNLDNVSENTQSAESRIRDTDMADEMVRYSKNNILAQAGQSMLAQANQSTQGVLSLLQ